jgi:predicted component of type VI protein secretion system
MDGRANEHASRRESHVEARLVVVGGDTERQYELHLPTVIGRSRRTDLRLGHPLVSRQHCEVFESNGLLMVRDLGSLNGTYVGDTRIAQQAMPVKPGELLTVGPVTFRAEYFAAPENRGRTSTWDTHNLTHDDPLPDGQGQVEDPSGELDDRPMPRDSDDETSPYRE